MPVELPEDDLAVADAAVQFAQQVRKYHRRRTERGNSRREADIRIALARIEEAMKPIRSEIGRFPYGPSTERAEANRQRIRLASQSLQNERRKLHKMKKTKKRKKPNA